LFVARRCHLDDFVERLQTGQREDRVIQVRPSAAITPGTLRREEYVPLDADGAEQGEGIAGTPRLCVEGGGGVVFTVAYMIAFTLSPSNGACPVSAS